MGRKVDPVTLSVFVGRLESITREMTWVIINTARSPAFKFGHDFSNCVFDARGQILVQGDEDIPAHLGTMLARMASIVEDFADDIHDGDIIFHNDPETGGGHLPDCTAATPLFIDDELIFWIASNEHQFDTGGMQPGGYHSLAEEIYQEGIRIPAVKIFERGKEKKDVIRLIMANWRTPVIQRGDVEASLGAIRLGKESLRDIVQKYGRQTIKDCIAETLDMGERRMREVIRKWPDGVYKGSAWVDNIRDIGDIELKVKITVKGDEVEVEWDTPPQVPAFINSYYGNTLSSTYLGILTASRLTPPYNAGCYWPIKVNFGRPGTMTNATLPAACSCGTTTIGQNLVNAMHDALSKFVPRENLIAGWGALTGIFSSSTDPRTGKRYTQPHLNGMGSGAGAVWGVDGYPGGLTEVAAGAMTFSEIEETENEMPYLIHHSQFSTDSAGAGRWRGGPGTDYTAEFPEQKKVTLIPFGEGEKFLPIAVGGAKNKLIEPKLAKRCFIRDNKEITIEPGSQVTIHEGETMIMNVQGGGGVGDPFERDVEAVRIDVVREIVSIEGAREEYGVVIDPETLEVNEEETQKLRRQERGL